jgi:hypothetical protein
MRQWSDDFMIKFEVLNSRLNTYHWSIEKALTTPVKKQNQKRPA